MSSKRKTCPTCNCKLSKEWLDFNKQCPFPYADDKDLIIVLPKKVRKHNHAGLHKKATDYSKLTEEEKAEISSQCSALLGPDCEHTPLVKGELSKYDLLPLPDFEALTSGSPKIEEEEEHFQENALDDSYNTYSPEYCQEFDLRDYEVPTESLVESFEPFF
ncbi:hypothetical protein DSO57_1011456 [Entomophthora muscae]|uniref:Uncharacterized protein n=1 Tax=Entomophthora muscae TaxID=34485 RepID=A0ACC2S7Z2_9FUNG|nr:hypothetical protein DSO57_1011456 [Entomophthora muscae]